MSPHPSLVDILSSMEEVDKLRHQQTLVVPDPDASEAMAQRLQEIYRNQGIEVDPALISQALTTRTTKPKSVTQWGTHVLSQLQQASPALAAAAILADDGLTRAGKVRFSQLRLVLGMSFTGNGDRDVMNASALELMVLKGELKGAPLAYWDPNRAEKFGEATDPLGIAIQRWRKSALMMHPLVSTNFYSFLNRYFTALMVWKILREGWAGEKSILVARWKPGHNDHLLEDIDEEAETFAVHLLLPEALIQEALKPKWYRKRVTTLAQLARRLDVPEGMLALRSGLLKQQLAG